nr:MAG TPA: hypothetical protein [Caudoviricetes sp.]
MILLRIISLSNLLYENANTLSIFLDILKVFCYDINKKI